MQDEKQSLERKQISADQFISIWTGKYLYEPEFSSFYQFDNSQKPVVTFDNCDIIDPISIDNQRLPKLKISNTKIGIVKLNNTITNDILIIDNSTVGDIEIIDDSHVKDIFVMNLAQLGNIYITNSIVQDIHITKNSQCSNIHLSESQSGYFYVKEQSECSDFYIYDNSIVGDLYVIERSKCRDFYIKNSSKIGNIYIKNKSQTLDYELNNSYMGNLEMFQNSFTGNFSIKNKSKVGEININYYSSAKSFYIQNQAAIQGFNIQDNSTIGDVEIWKESTTNYINIFNNSNTGKLSISDCLKIRNISISESTASYLTIVKSGIEQIEIINNSKIFEVNLQHLYSDSKNLNIQDSFIQKIQLQNDNPYTISTNNTKIWSLNLANTILPKDSFLNLNTTWINNLQIDSSRFWGLAVFNTIKPLHGYKLFKTSNNTPIFDNSKSRYTFEENTSYPSIITLINADLCKTQFIGCDLKGFSKFEFKNTKMLEIFMADTSLPEADRIDTIYAMDMSEADKKTLKLEQQRLVLSQFKKIYENRGDTVRSTQVLAEEMEVYRKQLRSINGLKGKEWWNNRAERLNLLLNRYSSYYGNNWLRGVATTIFINSAFFLLYCLLLGFRPGNNWHEFWKLAAYSLEFLNPLRKADFLQAKYNMEPNAGAIFIDYFSRIVVAYFVYQTIAAFRKFGKRSS